MFTKLFSSITDSTIWREPDHVRLVWITMLAKCDKHGIVYASVPGLADAARVSLESCQDALLKLSSPDEWSRSKDDGGRRIHEVDGGWMLINHSKYKKIKDADERREYVRQKVQEHREKHKPVNNDVNNVNNVNTGKPGKHIRSDQIRSDKEEETSAKASSPSLKVPIEAKEIILPEKFQTTRFCEMLSSWMAFRKKGRKSGNWRLFFKEELDKISDLSEPQAFEAVKSAFKSGWQSLYQPKEIKKEVKRQTYEELMNENASTKP